MTAATALVPFAGQQAAAAFLNEAGANQESLSEGIGAGYPVIGYRGKVFSIRHRGEVKVPVRADDGQPLGYIDVIILRQGKEKSKSFYPGGWDPNKSEGSRPTCSSLGGIYPDADAQTKQADTCALCPRNEWKTQQNGKPGRECTDYKRLAVLILPTISAPLYGGTPMMEPAFLRVPPASLQDLGLYGDTLNSQGFPYFSVVTRISFDQTMAHPKMVFRAVQKLSDAEAPVVIEHRNALGSKRITGEDQQGNVRPLGAVTAAPAVASLPVGATGLLPQPSPQQSIVVPASPAPQPLTIDVQAVEVIPAQTTTASPSSPVTATPAPPPAPTPQAVAVETGLTGLTTIAPGTTLAATAAAAPSQAPADTAAVPSDADLDAKVASLLANR